MICSISRSDSTSSPRISKRSGSATEPPARAKPNLSLEERARRVPGLAERAAHPAFGPLGLALGLQAAVAHRPADLLLDRSGGLLEAAYPALPLHVRSLRYTLVH